MMRWTALRRVVVATTRPQEQARRWMGSDMPKPQSSQAELWEGHPKTKEGWETTTYLTYAASAILLTLAVGFSPETSIKVWASNEAQARLDLKDKKGDDFELEFGKHYGADNVKYDFTSLAAENPFNEEDDDEDEEGDEDDDDEEEEEVEVMEIMTEDE